MTKSRKVNTLKKSPKLKSSQQQNNQIKISKANNHKRKLPHKSKLEFNSWMLKLKATKTILESITTTKLSHF